jgi:hypothetical protein
MILAPGEAVERYVVEAVLGEGGMAIVYRVRHVQLDTVHALKVLTLTHPNVRERFLQEGRVQATLRHTNVVSVTDVLEVNGAPALLMELIDGPSLADWIATTRPGLELAEAVFRGVVAGVAEAHRRGMVHRDLKPANVLLASVDGALVPKVADFGLVKLVSEDRASPFGATRSGMPMGTPAYMAPEQIRDAKRVDARADVFSLGCILYELVCHQPPFVGADLLELLTAVGNARFTPPESLKPSLPLRFRTAISECLRVDLDRRLQDCASLLQVLTTGVVTPVPTPPPPPRRPAPRHRWWGAAIGCAAVLAVVGAASLLAAAAWIGAGTVVEVVPDTGGSAEAPPEALAPDRSRACDTQVDHVIGYVKVNGPIAPPRGTWRPTSTRVVYANPPREEDGWAWPTAVVCELPRGARVRLDEPIVKLGGAGQWIPIVGTAIELP